MDQPRYLAFRLFRSELFNRHPYGLEILGTGKSIECLTRDDLLDFYQRVAVPGNLVIAVVGDVNTDEIVKEMGSLFSDWVAEPYTPEPVPLEPPPDTVREAYECKDVQQANIVIGFHGTRKTSEDRFPLQVLSSALSGMSGRLFVQLRGEQSLAYSVFAFSDEGIDPGIFGVYIGTAPEKEETSRAGIMKELEEVRDQPISQDELSRAQKVLIGEFEIGLQRYRAQAARYAADELFGLGFRASERYAAKIQAVSAEQVREVANRYIAPEAYVAAVVKPCTPQAEKESGPDKDITSGD
jgi:predicted Zn-dependent peptidase